MTKKITCLVPWVHSHIHPDNTRSLCCLNTDTLDIENHSEFWNHDHMKQARLTFLNGDHPKGCGNCFNDPNRPEDDRYYQQFNKSYEHLTEEIVNATNRETGETSFQPIDFDYRTKLCNMSCKTCGTYASTQSSTISNKAAGKTIFPIINYKDAQKRQSVDLNNILSNNTTQMYWAGGEPLMNPIYWDTLEYLKEKQWTNIRMVYHTNIARLSHEPTYQKALTNFNTFPSQIYVSIDGIKEVAEYVRNGTVWVDVHNNITKLAKDAPHTAITLDATLTNLTVLQLPDILKYAQEQQLKIVFKAMIEMNGQLIDNQWYDRNTFLSTNLLHKNTISKVYNQVKDTLDKISLDTNILPVLEFIMASHSYREPTTEDVQSATEMEHRHSNELSILNVIKNQSL